MPDPVDPLALVASLLNDYASREFPLTRQRECEKDRAAALLNTSAAKLFPKSNMSEAAVSGLLLLLGCWDESHTVSQDLETAEGSYWHGIAHRIEPDASNSAYWFRRVGSHPIFPDLRDRTVQILNAAPNAGWRVSKVWDPFLFIEWCDEARRLPGSVKEKVALKIQRTEWDLLYAWCAR